MTDERLNNRQVLLIGVVLLIATVVCGYVGIARMFSHWDWLNDLHFFYEAAELVTNGNRDILYDPAARLEAGYGWSESNQVFPYPVLVAYLFWPLTLTDLITARYIFMGVAIAAVVVLALVGYFWSRDLRFAVLMLLLPPSSFTFYETLRFNQLSPIIALMLAGAMLSAMSPKSILGGVLNGLLVLKPSIALAPLGLLTLRRGYLQIAIAAAVGAMIMFVIPLATVGFDGLQAYFELLDRYRDEGFKLDGEFTAGAGWMLGWQSIVGRLAEDDPSAAIVLPLCAGTLLLAGWVWLRGRWLESWLAVTLATLLVVPHVVWYDWLILLGVAPFVAYRNRSALLCALLLALHLSISFDSYIVVSRPIFDAYPVPTPLIAFAILSVLALQKQPAMPGGERGHAVTAAGTTSQ